MTSFQNISITQLLRNVWHRLPCNQTVRILHRKKFRACKQQ